jgi:hypothetical protein
VPVFAQKFSSSIRGTVTDPTGAAVSGAKVTLTNEGTGVGRTMNSNTAGNYSFPDIPVGSYRVEVEFAGFKLAVQNKVTTSVADTRVVDVKLETGAITETVSVEANPNAVKLVGAEISGMISGEQVRELPLNGRNFLQLTLLQPGVTALEGLNTVNKGLAGGSDISVSGGTTTSNLFLIDGADNVDHGSNRTILVYPSVDAIEEFKIQRNNYGAEFGGAGGAQINLVTRGGTNSLHGSAYYYARRDALNATDYFLKAADQDKQKLTWNDFGATLGGPIIKDKLHFFLSYEKNQDKKQEVRTSFVPSAAEKTGDFSLSNSGPCPQAPPIDPRTGQAFPNNTIPANRISPGGALMMKLISDPNGAQSGCGANWTQAVSTPIDWQQLHARVDWSLTNSTRVMVRYTQDSWTATNANTGMWGDDPFPVVGSTWDEPGRSLVAQLNQTIGQSMTNTLTFSYSANVIEVSRSGDEALIQQLNAAIPTVYAQDQKMHPNEAQPLANWGTLGPYANGILWNQAPWRNNQDLFVIKDDYSAVFGSHFIKAGILYSYNKKNEEPSNTSAENVQISSLAGYVDAAGVFHRGTSTGNAIADYLLSDTAWNSTELKANLAVEQRWSDIEFYLADSIKLSSRLTADIGFRISHMTPPWEASNRIGNFNVTKYNPNDPSPCNGMEYPEGTSFCQDAGLTGGSTGVNRYLVPTKAMYFAPRVGLAWDVFGTGRTSLRGGFGIFYNRERVSPGLGVGQNPPLSGTANVVRKLDSTTVVSGNAAPAYGAPGSSYDQVAANSHNYQWNMSFQQEIAKNTVLEVAYVGNKGVDQVGFSNLNEIPPAERLNYSLYGNSRLPDGTYAKPLVDDATGNGYTNSVSVWSHDRSSIYHGLQVALTSRFGQGSVASLAYTYAKVLADGGITNADGYNGKTAWIDSTQPQLDRSRGGNDRTHVFSGSVVLGLPKFEDKGPLVKHVLGDWQVTTIVQAGTGYPTTNTGNATIQLSVPGLNGLSGTNNPVEVPDRAYDASGDPVPCTITRNDRTQYLNPAAFTINGRVIGTNGNLSRSACEGPFMFQADASIYKNIHLGPRVTLQLRLEVFNIFNNLNFRADTLNVAYNAQNLVYEDAAGNVVSGNSPARYRIRSATAPSTFGQFGAARDPRTMQLGIRLTF